MNSATKDSITAAISNALAGNPSEMQADIESVLSSKVTDALELKKVQIANGLIKGTQDNAD